jgi:hypothetical protein
VFAQAFVAEGARVAASVREQKPRGRARTAARVLLVRGCSSDNLTSVVAHCASRRATAASPTAGATADASPATGELGGASASSPKGERGLGRARNYGPLT